MFALGTAMRDNNVARVILSSPKNYYSSDGLKSGYFLLARGDNAPRWDFVSLHSSLGWATIYR